MYVHITIFATLHHMTLILINTETSKMKLEISVLCSLLDFGEYLIPRRLSHAALGFMSWYFSSYSTTFLSMFRIFEKKNPTLSGFVIFQMEL